MNGLIQFLTKIQTFELSIVNNAQLKSPIKENGNKPAYSLTHEHITMILLLIRVKSEY